MALQGKPTFGNPICYEADGAAEVRMAFQVLVQVVKAQNDVAKLARTVWHVQFGNNGTVIADFGHQPGGIGQSEKLDRRAVGKFAKAAYLNAWLHGHKSQSLPGGLFCWAALRPPLQAMVSIQPPK